MKPPGDRGQIWYYLPVLGGFVPAVIGDGVARFLRDNFRRTRVGYRRSAQWLLGTALVTGPVLRLVRQPAFVVDPPLPNAADRLIFPGNQRVRLYDFHTERTTVFLKEGFSPDAMGKEISIRGPGNAGPFPNILAADPAGQWFEEPILDAWPLPRCPVFVDAKEVEQEALAKVEEWSARETTTVSAQQHAEALAGELTGLIGRLTKRCGEPFRDVQRWINVLRRRASDGGTVKVSRTHGDLQPGNILVMRRDRSVMVIDWEHARRRVHYYDRMVLQLRSRTTANLAQRLRDAISGRTTLSLEGTRTQTFARSQLAFFLLEDLVFFFEDSLSGPFLRIPRGLSGYRNQLASLGPELDGLVIGS